MIAKHAMNKKMKNRRVDGALPLATDKAAVLKLNSVKTAPNLAFVRLCPMGRSG
jgi:hypothetical protein